MIPLSPTVGVTAVFGINEEVGAGTKTMTTRLFHVNPLPRYVIRLFGLASVSAQRVHNPQVPGSNPGAATEKPRIALNRFAVLG